MQQTESIFNAPPLQPGDGGAADDSDGTAATKNSSPETMSRERSPFQPLADSNDAPLDDGIVGNNVISNNDQPYYSQQQQQQIVVMKDASAPLIDFGQPEHHIVDLLPPPQFQPQGRRMQSTSEEIALAADSAPTIPVFASSSSSDPHRSLTFEGYTPSMSHPPAGAPVTANKPITISRRIVVSNRNIFVSGLPTEVNDATLRQTFLPYGAIQSCRVLINSKTGKHKGVGFVHYVDAESAAEAIKVLNESKPFGINRALSVKYADEAAEFAPEESNKLFIRHVPKLVTPKHLKSLFESLGGRIIDASTRPDTSTQGKREKTALYMAYVTFQTIEEATVALSHFHLATPFGESLNIWKPLEVKYAETLECRNHRRRRTEDSGQPVEVRQAPPPQGHLAAQYQQAPPPPPPPHHGQAATDQQPGLIPPQYSTMMPTPTSDGPMRSAPPPAYQAVMGCPQPQPLPQQFAPHMSSPPPGSVLATPPTFIPASYGGGALPPPMGVGQQQALFLQPFGTSQASGGPAPYHHQQQPTAVFAPSGHPPTAATTYVLPPQTVAGSGGPQQQDAGASPPQQQVLYVVHQ